MRFAFIAAEKARHAVTRLCRCLRVTPSGFYAWTTRGLSARAQRDGVLRTKLRAFHAASGQRYGRPNLWKDLQEDGEAVSEKRVARLMREEGIRGRVRRRFKTTTMSDHADPIAQNVLARDFTAAGPNQRWVGETTEFRIGEGESGLREDRPHRACGIHDARAGSDATHHVRIARGRRGVRPVCGRKRRYALLDLEAAGRLRRMEAAASSGIVMPAPR